jgi:hypothetical protein
MISNTTNRTRLSVSGTTYDFEFRIDDESELEVYGVDADDDVTLLTTGFSISFDADTEDGTVTFDSEPSTYEEILMIRSKAYTQNTDIPIRAGFSEEDIENALDHVVMLIQQVKEITDRCVQVGLAEEGIDMTELSEDLADAEASAVAAAASAAAAAASASTASSAASAASSSASAASSSASAASVSAAAAAVSAATAAANVALGSWASRSDSTVYQAATDGFIILKTNNINYAFYTDGSNPPTTKRGATSAGTEATICCPIKKNDYYKGTPASGGSDSFYFIPLGT